MLKPIPVIRAGFSLAGSEIENAGEMAVEVNGKRAILGPEFDPLDQATDQFGGFRPPGTIRQRLAQRGNLVPVTARQVRVKQDRVIVSRGELPLELGLAVFKLGAFLGQTFAGNPVQDRPHDPVQLNVDL